MCIIYSINTHLIKKMRTNIVIDEKLMNDALQATGLKTKKEVVELGLKILVKLNRQKQIKELRGKLEWDGDLDAMRRN
jgi:Arc/MetJ family transcription regulator